MTDLFGDALIYDTICENNTILTNQEDRTIMHRNITGEGETLQLIHLKNENYGDTAPEFNNDERKYERDLDRSETLNVMVEEYDHLNEILIKNCTSWKITNEHADPKLVITMITYALSRLNVPDARVIVGLVSQKKRHYDTAAIWELSINHGQIYVNELSAALLNKSKLIK